MPAGSVRPISKLPQEATGVVPEGVLRDLCFQHNVPLDPDMLDLLVGWCRSSEGRKSTLLWPMFVDLINWKGTYTCRRTARHQCIESSITPVQQPYQHLPTLVGGGSLQPYLSTASSNSRTVQVTERNAFLASASTPLLLSQSTRAHTSICAASSVLCLPMCLFLLSPLRPAPSGVSST